MMTQQKQSGFTAVELLITLFVAAAFLIAGYQLFNVVIKDGGQARAESTAGNVAYDYLRRYAPQATNPCTESTVLNNADITVDGLSNVKITVDITCPPAYSTPALSKIEATLTYNIPEQTSTYSTFTNGISGNTPLDVTDGLIGWWKLNGNTEDSIGLNDGTGANITPTDGQNGQPNGAYTFNGTSSRIVTTNSSIFNASNLTFSAWAKPTSSSGTQTFIGKEFNYKYRALSATSYGVLVGVTGASWTTLPTFTSIYTAGSWVHVAVTISSTNDQIILYVNGAPVGSPAALATDITAYNSNDLVVGSYTSSGHEGVNGALDDVRFYNRVLSATEIQALYTGGAK